jgi:cytoskeletal protein CcmA (bactofilin family)
MWRKSEGSKSKVAADVAGVADSAKQQGGAGTLADSPSAVAAVSRSLKFRGEISGQGDFFFDGEFEGKIHLEDGTFTVGPNARVNAEIEARQIIVRGEVIGTIKAHERVHILSTAKLTGNMETCGIVIEDGAELHSKVATPQTIAAAAQIPEPKVAPPEAASAKEVAPEVATPQAALAEPAAVEKGEAIQPLQPGGSPRRKRAAAGAPGQSDSQES